MNYRMANILTADNANTAATKTKPINLKEPISQIQVQFKATNSTNTPTAHPATCITKLELVDGSDVLYSLSGKEAWAQTFWDVGRPACNILSYIDNNMNVGVYTMSFGRYLYDERFALDPTKFDNLQLNITHDKALGGGAPDAATLDIIAHVFDEKVIAPEGFLMTKEHYSYTPGSSGSYEYIPMPTDHPIRMMSVFGRLDSYQPWQVVNEIKLSEDNDKRIPMDDKVSDILKYMSQLYGRYNESLLIHAAAADDLFYCTPTYEVYPTGTGTEDQDKVINLTADSYGGVVSVEAEGATEANIDVAGYAPNGGIAIPFGKQNDDGDWYDVTKVGDLELRLKAGSNGSSTTAQIVTQQMRRY